MHRNQIPNYILSLKAEASKLLNLCLKLRKEVDPENRRQRLMTGITV